MILLEAMQELLHCESVNGKTASHAILAESDPSAILRRITLSNLAPGMLVLHIDSGRKVFYTSGKQRKTAAVCMSPLFSTTTGRDANRGCDAVLIYVPDEHSPTCEVFYIELKSDSPADYAGQFRSTACFFQYVRILLQEFWGVEMTIARQKYIVLYTNTRNARPTLGKQPTRPVPRNANSPDRPERHVVLNGMDLSCTKLF